MSIARALLVAPDSDNRRTSRDVAKRSGANVRPGEGGAVGKFAEPEKIVLLALESHEHPMH
ncbi:MAG TPA: hypothetical protein VF328_22255, partial [Mycobacterium sp.]